MNNMVEAVVTIATGIIGVAILAVLVSQKSNTAAVIQNFGSAFSNALGVAESPVNGNAPQLNTSYASSGGIGGFGSLPQLGSLYA
jgi:PRD1 phage membrane DNA delivery